MNFTREDVELYMMGEFDGDRAALEKALAEDPALAAIAAGEAELELLLRDAAAQATFCPACNDLVKGDRCDACGCALSPGGYVVDKVLVSNAHGRMYVAHDADGKQVALKELAFVQSPTIEVIAAFEREAKLLRALEHPAIPRFVASFEEGTGVHTRYYLAQELVAGPSLDARLADHFYSEAELIDIARQVLDVLVYLQGVSPMVIHRDIKPANLIARTSGTIAVVDFGAAHVQGTTAGSTSIGTFGYMPIEQLAGQVDATTDAYALGASLLHLSSRKEPWRILQGLSLEGINVSPAMRGFLAKLVAPEPKDRFANALAAREALDNVAKGVPVIDELAFKRAQTKAKRRWFAPVAIGGAVAAALAAGAGAHALLSEPSVERVEKQIPADVGLLAFDLRGRGSAELFLDGQRITVVKNGVEIPIPFGEHHVKLLAPDGAFCESQLVVQGNAHTTMSCELDVPSFPEPPKPKRRSAGDGDHIPPGRPIDVDFKDASIPDVIRVIGDACHLSVVTPDYVRAKTTVRLKQAPCDQALEVVLESNGLWYRYVADGNMLLIAERKDLDREAEARRQRISQGVVDDPLPKGPALDLDFKDASLADLMRILADMAQINIVIPDYIRGKVTIKLKQAPWGAALRTILESQGLWYRYRPNGKLLRIAERKELDREDEAARQRDQLPVPRSPVAILPTGKLELNSNPPSKISVDGKQVGNTPLVLELIPGKHKVMFEYLLDGISTRSSYVVQVKEGELNRVIKDFR